ncbi:hypothetical protein Bbelb_147230 [Branchiostoma belcheri]|nr:hypothetical protein Bbelb_147230 [Branchiostoma belcheri]
MICRVGVYLLVFQVVGMQIVAATRAPPFTSTLTVPSQPGPITIAEVTVNSIKITWAAAAGAVDSYTISIFPTGDVVSVSGGTREHTFTGLTAGTEYTISVVTVSGGLNSVARTYQQRTMPAQPGAITIAVVTENSIRITWAAAAGAVDNYDISISPTDGVINPTGSVDAATLEHIFTGLSAGILYTISVITDSGGEKSLAREETQRTTVAQPGSISILPAEVTENSIRITWAAAAGAKELYDISISPDTGVTNPTGSVNDGATLEYTFNGLTAGTLYTISVITDSGGVKSEAREATQRTTVAQPGAISILPAEVTENSIRITWAAAAGAKDSYSISISPADGDNPTASVIDGDPPEYTFTGLTAEPLPAAPGAITIAEVTTNSFKISWEAAAGVVESYTISISLANGISYPVVSVSDVTREFTFTGLTAGTLYTISVVTVSGGLNSVAWTQQQRTMPASPGAITIAEVTTNSFKISWEAAAGVVESYTLSISLANGISYPVVSVSDVTREFTFTGLTAGTLYTISVVTVSGGLNSVAWTQQQRTVPASPGAITIAEVTTNSFKISWEAAAGVVESYTISISLANGISYPVVSVSDVTREFTFTGLTAGTLYTISVVTVSGGLNSVAWTQQQRTVPAQSGVITITEVTENSIRITWAAAAGVKDSYDIRISPGDGENPTGSVNDGDTLEYTFTGLTGRTEYTISVTTISGGMSSDPRTKIQRTSSGQPGEISIAPSDVTETSIRVTWTATEGSVDSYRISISPADGASSTGSVNAGDTLEHIFTGLTAGTLYTINVVSVSGGVNSVARTAQQRTTVAQPGEITIALSGVTENSIKITWTAAAGAKDSYDISISPNDGVTNPTGNVNDGDSLEYTFTGLTAGTLYTISVVTVSGGVNSVARVVTQRTTGTEYIIIAVTVSGGVNSVARTTTQRTTVAQPGDINIAPSDVSENSIRITWTAAAGAKDSYIIIISPDTDVTNPTGTVNDGDILEYTFTGLTAGTLYAINVITVSGGVNSVARTKQQRTTVAQPGVISIVPSDVTENSIRITWTAAAGAKDSYNIDISPTGSVNDGDTLEYSFNSLTAAILYTISVTTVRGGENSVARVKEQRTNAKPTSTRGTYTSPPTTVTGSPHPSTSSPATSLCSTACGAESGVYAGIAVGTGVAGVVVGVLATLLVQHMRAKRGK